ncbi:integrase, catalytic region, zinc finger, CCHC-type containing protein [Tanacetum coccineum]
MSDNSLTKHIWKPKGKLSDNCLKKTKQIWKPKGKLSDNSLYKTRQVWKATGKLFADIGYQWRPTGKIFALWEICQLTKLSVKCCSKHMTRNRSKLMNFVEKFIGSVIFGNDHLGAIMGYGDYVMGDSVISRVYYMEGLGYNLFSVGKFCDSDLEVAFRKHTCFIRDLNGTDILKGSRGTNLYMISIDEMMKKYILVIVDDYTRFTWVKFLRSKDETPEFVTNFLKQIQVGLNKTVRFIRTDNGTEFVNQALSTYYEGVGITHQKSVPKTPQQNGVVERRNRTLVEAARTMMILSKWLLFV